MSIRKKINERKKRENKRFTAGGIKDQLAREYRKTGTLGKEEKLSIENASKVMKGAKEIMNRNPNMSKQQVMQETQKKLEMNAGINEAKLKEQKVRQHVQESVENWKKQGLVRREPSREAVERTGRFANEAYEELKRHKLPIDITQGDIQRRVNEKITKWKKQQA